MKKRLFLAILSASLLGAQIYSPQVLREGQPDSTNLARFTTGIYQQANAATPREKAEAIWRFFLTDGRFVKPGFWYHIAGWAYEEPFGEVLDPMKLLNSYGFGLCYHIAPLLEAVYEAGGFADARVWFLTGHTVAEVFYDGAYHYFDSDMMGYNVAGGGPFQNKPVAGVRQLEKDSNIILGKLAGPRDVRNREVDYPWYPADVRAAAMDGLAELFTTSNDNYLYPYTRYSEGHRMDFVLRPGERLIRYFQPEEPGLFYLPYQFDGAKWQEFPQQLEQYKIRTSDGPRSQKDQRLWATGRIEYTPRHVGEQLELLIDMPSPYVIIDAQFTMSAKLRSQDQLLRVETSTDGGQSWDKAGELRGPHEGAWSVEPRVLARTEHGRFTAVSGTYGYKVRITRSGAAPAPLELLRLVSRIQINPRTLPALEAGESKMLYTAAPAIERVALPVRLDRLAKSDFELVEDNGQRFLRPAGGRGSTALFELSAGGAVLSGFDAGARFLDLRGGLAPNKLTAETRATAVNSPEGPAAIEWSLTPEGPFQELWSYPKKLEWRDGDPVDRLLLWPEVFRQVRDLPAGTRKVYVRMRSAGPSLDNIRLAVLATSARAAGELRVTHLWRENGTRRQHEEIIGAQVREKHYTVKSAPGVQNEAILLELR